MLLEIFLVFMKIGAMSFGGAYASIPLVEKQIVEVCGWMSYSEFADLLAIDELTPGPILINCATYVGMRMASLPGAIAATAGCIAIPCLVSALLITIYHRYRDLNWLKLILQGLRCMTLAMIVSTFLKMADSILFIEKTQPDLLSIVLAVSSFAIIRRYRPDPVYVMLGCGVISLILSMI